MLKQQIILIFLICSFLGQSFSMTQAEYDYLVDLDASTAPDFSLEGMTFLGKVDYVIDGDSVKLILLFGDGYYRFDGRVADIDTPQTRSGDVRQFGKQVGAILEGMIEGKILRVEAGEMDKYGRLLTHLYAEQENGPEICINTYMVQHKMAFWYDGGTKRDFVEADHLEFLATYENYTWPTIVNYPYQQMLF